MGVLPLGTNSCLQDLFDVLATVLVCRFKVVQFLLELRNVFRHSRRLGRQTLLNGRNRCGNKPSRPLSVSPKQLEVPEVTHVTFYPHLRRPSPAWIIG